MWEIILFPRHEIARLSIGLANIGPQKTPTSHRRAPTYEPQTTKPQRAAESPSGQQNAPVAVPCPLVSD
eukprot:6430413-Pyramimonas_sp.AAC.1